MKTNYFNSRVKRAGYTGAAEFDEYGPEYSGKNYQPAPPPKVVIHRMSEEQVAKIKVCDNCGSKIFMRTSVNGEQYAVTVYRYNKGDINELTVRKLGKKFPVHKCTDEGEK